MSDTIDQLYYHFTEHIELNEAERKKLEAPASQSLPLTREVAERREVGGRDTFFTYPPSYPCAKGSPCGMLTSTSTRPGRF